MLCLTLVTAPFAPAQWRTSQDAEICITGTGQRSLDIPVCTRALRGEGLSALDRASVHTARGKALRGAGKLAAAIADFDAAVELNPDSADAFHERAVTRDVSGDYREALNDFRRALALSPRFAAAYRSRGLAHFYAGFFDCAGADLDSAAALARNDAETHVFRGFVHYLAGRSRHAAGDFRRAHALAPLYPYLPLWRYLTGDASAVLAEARAELLPDEWPHALVQVYLGELDPETLIDALEKDQGLPSARRRLAASHFYLGALARLGGREQRALSHLSDAVALSERRMPERVLAEQELAAGEGQRSARPISSASECRR